MTTRFPSSPLAAILGFACLFLFGEPLAKAGDWPMWRGPNRNGVAEAGQEPPLSFDSKQNCLWAVPIPGRGHGSAAVHGDKVFLAVAEEDRKVQSLLCLDRETGTVKWSTEIHRDGLTQKLNQKATWASGTPACDGERVYINFLHDDAVYTTALDLGGKQLWQVKISPYQVHQGYAASPTLYRNLVIATADNKLGGAVCGLDRETGREVWRISRPKLPNYVSPIVLTAAGRDQLFLSGVEKVSSFDPLTGNTLWEIEGATTECVTTTPTDGERIFTSGGYPKNHVAAIAADGSGKVAWQSKDRVYVPSLLVKDGHLFGVLDGGVAMCWDSATGEEKWKARLGGTFSGSPVLVGDRIYVGNEAGTVYVFKAGTGGLEVLAENKVGGEVFSTPAICGGRIFLRVADYQGEKRQETLYCFGSAKTGN